VRTDPAAPPGAQADFAAHGDKKRCYFILSTKSSGSSVLQRHLSGLTSARLPETDHSENETLFFTKAASILGLPQQRLVHSEAPFSSAKAKKSLQQFLSQNLGEWHGHVATEADAFRAWSAIVHSGSGDVVEKSPHHLYQESVVELMERYADSEPDIDVHFIGLIRNPLATLYSSWRRFGMRPALEEGHWVRAYETLLRLAERRPEQVTIIRYEELVTDPARLASLLGIEGPLASTERLHSKSLERWRQDRRFRHHLSDEAIRVAGQFGYRREELSNEHAPGWTLRNEARALAWDLLFALPGRSRIIVQTHLSRVMKSALALWGGVISS
jgi:hypothetical protein